MKFEEKLDRVIILLECLLEEKATTVGFSKVETTLDIPKKTETLMSTPPSKFTQKDIRELVKSKKENGFSQQVLKETLNNCGYSSIADIEDKHVDFVYNSFLSLV